MLNVDLKALCPSDRIIILILKHMINKIVFGFDFDITTEQHARTDKIKLTNNQTSYVGLNCDRCVSYSFSCTYLGVPHLLVLHNM